MLPLRRGLFIVIFLAACAISVRASTLSVPNASFETPLAPRVSPYAFEQMEYWQKSPQPAWYDPAQNYNTPWDWLMGTFYNAPLDTFIDNCDGDQAAFLFVLPDIAIFQDRSSSPTFNATFKVNCAYTLTIGVIGGGGGMPQGATLDLRLYYRDGLNNISNVAATTVTHTQQLFPTNTHFLDFSLLLPGVLSSDPWAGQYIGVQIAATAGFALVGGYWDVDNVRLTEIPLPALINPQFTNSQFSFTLLSQPGLRFDILAATNLALPLSNWPTLATLTNTTGIFPFLDPALDPNRRFYRARQLP